MPNDRMRRDRPATGAEPAGIAVAIPARDEAARLPACLAALAAQRGVDGGPSVHGALVVLVLANDCSDATAAVARSLAPSLPFRLVVRETTLPPGKSHAGGARRAAMDAAAALLRPDGLLLSTDADARADRGWLAANLAAFAVGADAVAGRVVPDPEEQARLPPALRRREAAEAHFAALLNEMAALVDPDPHDPWPRHGVHSGASIALTLDAHRRVGGVPPVSVGEDRALFAALKRAGLRVRHCPTARVVASCRLDGRAPGGMAATLRRRLADAEAAPVDSRLEPALDALLRLRCRHALRRLQAGAPRPGDPLRLALALGVTPARLHAAAASGRFWPAWEALQAASPLLHRRRVLRVADLPAETARAEAVLDALRADRTVVRPGCAPPAVAAARRGGTAPPVAAA